MHDIVLWLLRQINVQARAAPNTKTPADLPRLAASRATGTRVPPLTAVAAAAIACEVGDLHADGELSSSMPARGPSA